MGIDMSKMKAKLGAINNKGSKDVFWRPKDGEQTLRILPVSDGDPFKEFWFHYNVGKSPGFLSLKKNFGEDCPLDRFVKQLWSEGDEESVKMAKNLSARQRFFSPVLVRGEEDQGVKIWGYGKMAYQELLNLVLNPDYGDVTDVEDGTDLVITYGKPAGAQFPQTTITPRRRSSPLVEDKNKVSELLESIPDFSGLFEKKSYQDVQALLDEFLLGDDGDAENASSEEVKYSNDSDKAKTSVDDAFAELLG